VTHEGIAAFMDAYRPHLIPLDPALTAAVFPLMKIIPAEFCLRQAMRDRVITRDSLIVESSSGTMALGLAIVCNRLGFRLTIVSDHALDDSFCRRLRDLGATVERVGGPAPVGGDQRARLDRVQEIMAANPNSWWLNQYHNSCNAGAYSVVASQIVEVLGAVDCLIGAVGSGGSVCGTAAYLRVLFPAMKVVAVDTFHSVLFAQPDGPRTLRGLGNSLLPANLDHTMIDEVHWVTAAEAYTATRMLHRQSALFRGATSGAVWLAAKHWAATHPGARAVCLFADDGSRYGHDLYDDDYLARNGLHLETIPAAPEVVDRPDRPRPCWSMFDWNRRSYAEVVEGLQYPADTRELVRASA
jgi:S-sulfo-L-cysteine synthase (3-phospho-L-serine-dependent)